MKSFSRSLAGALPVGISVAMLGGVLCVAPFAHAQIAPVAASAPVADTSWTTFKGDSQRTGGSDANLSLPLALQWRFSSTAPARNYVTAPLVAGAPGRQNVIFAAGNNVYALDSATGAQNWKSPDLPSGLTVPLTLISTEGGDLILALQDNGSLVALQSSNGERVWETALGALATASGPIVVQTAKGTRILCALNTGRLVALDDKGVIDPDFRLQLAVGASATSSMSLSSDGSRLFVMGSDSNLYVVDLKAGRVLYVLTQAARSSVTPVVYGDTVLTANARRLSAWSVDNGAPKWTIAPAGTIIGSPAVMTDATGNGGTLYFGTGDGQFEAVNAATGTVKWQKSLGETVIVTGSPLALRNVVMVGTSEGNLVGFNPADGSILWQYRLQTERVADLTASTSGRGGRRGGGGGRGNAGSQEARAYGVSSAPAAIDNKLFVLGDNAALYAFTALPFDADPPRIVEPSVAVNATDRELLSLLLAPDNPQIVPGTGPFYFAAQVDDVGSGVDPNSIQVSLDDAPVDAARVDYNVANSVLTVTLVDSTKNDPALTDGLKKVTIAARDYAGNALNYSINFLVDNSAPVPAAPGTATGRGGNRGGGRGGFGR